MTSAREKLEAILSRLTARASDEKVFLKVYAEQARAAADAAEPELSPGPADPAALVGPAGSDDQAVEPLLQPAAGEAVELDAADLEALDTDQLVRLEQGLHHWDQLAQRELRERARISKEEESE
jgi:hypothetical protein